MLLKRWLLLIICGLMASLWTRPAASLPLSAPIDFAKDIQPIFEQTCYPCHGPDQVMGQLRLDERRLAMKGGISGPVIVPGNSKESRLLHRILGEGGEARMPFGGKVLTPEQTATIRAWIDQGAVWPSRAGEDKAPQIKTHWAYVKPERPALPTVKNTGWVRNPIDQFILARLEKEGLGPSPEASKTALIRRAYLDLIGLPPGIKEVDDFLADAAPDAFEKIVDHLLASPHYGERWARPWLDLARYADSNGYEKDRPRVIWKYRDWVIHALNRDMPFDQFTIEQIAGDMLPNATAEQKIATGFHRNTMLNEEGGVDQEESRWERIIDRVNTTATVWLGTTLGCAQCHNHKYDPFSQKDFYRMFAFFETSTEPKLDLPTPEQDAKRKTIEAEINKLTETLKTQTPELDAEQADWEQQMRDEPNRWSVLDPLQFKSTGGTTLVKQEDKSLLATGANPETDTYIIVSRTPLKEITGLRLEALPDACLPQGGPGRDPYGNFLLSGIEVLAAPVGEKSRPLCLLFSTAVVDDAAFRFDAKGLLGSGPLVATAERPKGWPIDATRDPLRFTRQAVFKLSKPIGFEPGTEFTVKLKHLGGSLGQGIGRVRLSVTTDKDPLNIVSIPGKLRVVLDTPADQRTKQQKADLATQYRANAPRLKPARERLKQLNAASTKLGIVSTLVMQERVFYERPSTYLRERGNFLAKGAKVFAATPGVLHPMPESQPVNRLGLAHWLVDENNPLAARVTVNRFWEQIFGQGIVETSEDFGSQGQRPTHTELLDWLATEFMRQKWSMKSLLRLIVTSATYRQASEVRPAWREKDPYNRLLARGPRFRLEAEMIRDLALAAGGLLSPKIGGPSVFPSQPEGVWRNPYSEEKWVTSQGEDRYRRSLYTFLRRTAPYPSFMTFDATSRETCTARRVRTNTPLQALAALNDEGAFEAARALANRMLSEISGDVRARTAYGFRLCLTRAPKAEELDRLVALYDREYRQLTRKTRAAEQTTKVAAGSLKEVHAPELAAWTLVANVLLNLDETLTKE